MARRLILRSLFIALFTVLLLGATSAFADDLFPPPWRGLPGTTYAEWGFGPGSDPFNPIIPDDYYNPNGTPTATWAPGEGQVYKEFWGGREGVLPLSGEIVIDMPNYPTPNPLKEIWIQVTWAAQVPGEAPYVWADAPGYIVQPAEIINVLPLGPTLEPPPADGMWLHTTYRIVIEPNPQFEQIVIIGAIMVDQVVVDTYCVPEPATMSLLGLGGVAILLRFRRKK
ncbi:MAG: PEP-CTERM sorting domain-containing protein [Verrucomicrobia bacterium]|nr:PEP-CTERM sorting domain-containing protein [Verrucomicrobiota bacterium]